MIGFWMRASRARNAAINTAATPPMPATWKESQPCVVASTIAYIALMSEAVTSTEPTQSTPCSNPRPLSARMSACPRARVARPIGRLTKKTQCQLSAWVRRPPASRPTEPPATETNT
jgi:hypothetical protein